MRLEERVKQASLLHENLLFEAGLYTASAWEGDGGKTFDLWHPPGSFDLDALIRDDEKFQPTGGNPYVKFDNYVFASGPAERQFRAQFHVLLHKMGAEDLPWVTMQSFEAPSELDNDIKDMARKDHHLVAQHISASRRLQEKIAYNLNRDLTLTAQLQMPASMDELFSPIVHQKAHRYQPKGLAAWQVAVPNWSTLQWDEILRLREHLSLVEFQKKMVTVERMAKEAAAQSSQPDLRYEISRIITDEVTEELMNLRKTPKDVIRDVLIDLVTSPLSGVNTIVTAIRGDLQLQAQNKSWTTAFFKLRNLGS